VLVSAYVFGLLGASAVPAWQAVASWLEGGALAAPTGLAAYGGLCGGTLGAVMALRRRGLDVRTFLDAAAPAVALGIFFARIGCFMAGCDYGRVTGSALGTSFPVGSPAFRDQVAAGLLDPDAAASLPVHPTELYEAGVGLALFLGLGRFVKTERFAVLVVAYAVARAAIETLRGDASRGHLGPLSTAQMFAIATAAVAIGAVVVTRRRVVRERQREDEHVYAEGTS
jgi:prolipoprotein diacylglyceryltransferase